VLLRTRREGLVRWEWRGLLPRQRLHIRSKPLHSTLLSLCHHRYSRPHFKLRQGLALPGLLLRRWLAALSYEQVCSLGAS